MAETVLSGWWGKGFRVHFTQRYLHWGDDGATGRKRMQLLKFIADEFSNAEYIGILDSDTLFTTKVTDHAIFEGLRPRIIAEVGRPKQAWHRGVPLVTAAWLRRPEDISCMSYFPIVCQREHFSKLRMHLEALHGRPYEELAD